LGFLLTLRIGELGGEFERILGRAPLVSAFLLRELLLILVGEPFCDRRWASLEVDGLISLVPAASISPIDLFLDFGNEEDLERLCCSRSD